MIDTLAGWLLFICVVIWIIADRLIVARSRIDRRNAEQDAQTAADHGERPRAAIEADWRLFPADEFRDERTPIHDETAADLLRAELDDEEAVARWIG